MIYTIFDPIMPSIMSLLRTPEALEALELAIAESHGSIAQAARATGCKPSEIRNWMLADPEVQNRLQTARMIGHAALEDEAIRRATGYTEDVYYQGEVVGTKQVYSDGLLTTLLKARITEYQADASTTAVQVNVNLMPRADNYEEWLIQREHALALPAPTIEEGEFEDVREDPPVRLRDVL